MMNKPNCGGDHTIDESNTGCGSDGSRSEIGDFIEQLNWRPQRDRATSRNNNNNTNNKCARTTHTTAKTISKGKVHCHSAGMSPKDDSTNQLATAAAAAELLSSSIIGTTATQTRAARATAIREAATAAAAAIALQNRPAAAPECTSTMRAVAPTDDSGGQFYKASTAATATATTITQPASTNPAPRNLIVDMLADVSERTAIAKTKATTTAAAAANKGVAATSGNTAPTLASVDNTDSGDYDDIRIRSSDKYPRRHRIAVAASSNVSVADVTGVMGARATTAAVMRNAAGNFPNNYVQTAMYTPRSIDAANNSMLANVIRTTTTKTTTIKPPIAKKPSFAASAAINRTINTKPAQRQSQAQAQAIDKTYAGAHAQAEAQAQAQPSGSVPLLGLPGHAACSAYTPSPTYSPPSPTTHTAESKLTPAKKIAAHRHSRALESPTQARTQSPQITAIATAIATATAVTTVTTTVAPATTITTTSAAHKSKSTENKCPSKEQTAFSKQREVEAFRSIAVEETRLSLETYTQHWLAELNQRVRNELWQYEQQQQQQQKGLLLTQASTPNSRNNRQQATASAQSLAERKAKLKLDFFKDNALQQLTQQLINTESKSQALPLVTATSKRLLRKANPLRLQISSSIKPNPELARPAQIGLTPKQEAKRPASPVVAEVSLIAQRKLDLQHKLRPQQQFASYHSQSYQPALSSTAPTFPRVRQLIDKFNAPAPAPSLSHSRQQRNMIVQPNKAVAEATGTVSLKPDVFEQRHSPLSDEGCNLGQSPYSSDNEDNESIRTASTTIERSKRKERVTRSASSDSALGLELDDNKDGGGQPQLQQQRRMTLTVTDLPLRPALLPLAEPTNLPDSPTPEMQHSLHNLIAQTTVPSKVLLEERVVEIPEEYHHPRQSSISGVSNTINSGSNSNTAGNSSLSDSRRESAQSCVSDYPSSECSGVRYVRTPSVVVSDYSDDVMCGITLEEIEYFRAHRMRRRRSSMDTAGTEKDGDAHSDVSAASSCSNLYFCGSTISALDGSECFVNGVRTCLERKTSDCSTCSASGDEDTFTIPEQPEDAEQLGQDLADLLEAQHLSTKRAKKVGLLQLNEAVPGRKLDP